MIFGIGADIVEVERIEDAIKRFGDDFANRVLAKDEMPGYLSSNTKARFLAKRFAAKEAFSKALGTGLREPVTFQNIVVSHDVLGKPEIVLAECLQELLKQQRITQMHLTISDEKNLATAFVVLEK